MSSSNYKGRNFRPNHTARGQSAVQGGGGVPNHAARGGQDPFLNEISAIAIERYIDAVHQYSLNNHALTAPWLRGRIPVVMLEHELPRTQEKLLGRTAKHHTLDDGSTSTVNLTAAEVRTIMIDNVVAENVKRRLLTKDTKSETGVSSMESGSSPSGGKKGTGVGLAKDSRTEIGGSSMDADRSPGGSEIEPDESTNESEDEKLKEEALRDLFPHNAKKSREMERSYLWKEAGTLLGKMFYFWPSKDIQTKMQATPSLVEAFENNDVIRFVDELRLFSLTGSGNPESNREEAERHLTSLKMKTGKALEYFKEFTEAVDHVRVCKSSFSDFKIVDLFFRNIDQTSFPGWHVKFLTEDDPMYRFQKLKFEDAKDHALKYHNTVIRVNDRTGTTDQNKKPERTVKTFHQLKSALVGTGTTSNPIPVDPVVLSTLLQTVSKAAAANKAAAKKRRAEGEGKDEAESKKKIKAETDAAGKKICWKFRDTGNCEFGANCYFSHLK